MRTLNDFIKELQRISEDKKELPLVIDCPNGVEVYPSIRMRWSNPFDAHDLPADKMVITWVNPY